MNASEECLEFDHVMKIMMNHTGQLDYVDWSTRSDIKVHLLFFLITNITKIGLVEGYERCD